MMPMMHRAILAVMKAFQSLQFLLSTLTSATMRAVWLTLGLFPL
jgi:hypothetical protein